MEKQKKLPIVVLIIGIISLIVGLVFLIITLTARPKVADANFLVQIGQWEEDGADGVIWSFTNIGEGTLTTNNHTNDYNFVWSIEGDKLKIRTDWLYDIDNEYTYSLDQKENILTLIEGSDEIHFYPASSINTEVREDN